MTTGKRKESFSIGDVEKMTGIKPVTLRMWEQRYGLEASEKKKSGHRLYSGEDVAKLRLIKEGLNVGMRISSLASLSSEALIKAIRDYCKEKHLCEPINELWFYEILSEAKSWNQYRLRKVLEKKFSETKSTDFYQNFLGPFIGWVGLQWQIGLITVSHEHFISDVLTAFLYSKSQPTAQNYEKKVLLTTLEGENHSLGMKMCAALLCEINVEPICIGASLPVDELVDVIKDSKVDEALISISAYYPVARARGEIRKLMSNLPSTARVLLGGAGSYKIAENYGALTIINNFDELARMILK